MHVNPTNVSQAVPVNPPPVVNAAVLEEHYNCFFNRDDKSKLKNLAKQLHDDLSYGSKLYCLMFKKTRWNRSKLKEISDKKDLSDNESKEFIDLVVKNATTRGCFNATVETRTLKVLIELGWLKKSDLDSYHKLDSFLLTDIAPEYFKNQWSKEIKNSPIKNNSIKYTKKT